jgi:hypothetical protein
MVEAVVCKVCRKIRDEKRHTGDLFLPTMIMLPICLSKNF